MQTYPLISEHGLIGDLQTSALVSTHGSIDWFCAPRVDSPSVFGGLLDRSKGGHCTITPRAEDVTYKQLYLPDTAILVTRFMTEAGVGEVTDFMPVHDPETPQRNHRIVRLLRCVRGRMGFDIDFAPRFDYGRASHELEVTDDGAVFVSAGESLTVNPVREPGDERLATFATVGGTDVRGQIMLEAGQVRGVVLDVGEPTSPRVFRVAEIQEMLARTTDFWTSWLARCTYTGRWRETLHRSAITLKLMTYAPTGAIVAAPTAGLPEQVGGERNWDYRYTWVRDASFSVFSLLGLGFTDEAAAFAAWLRDRVVQQPHASEGPLNIMYRVDGSPDLTEEILDHWEGYRGSYPVRIGNGAAGQLQLDIYGEAIDSLYQADRHGLELGHQGWRALSGVLDWLVDNWDRSEEGIWETRGGRKNFTYGRLMSWVAFDRGIRLAAQHGRPAPADRWMGARDRIYDQIMTSGWSTERQAFVQHYDDTVLDSALLRMGSVGFVSTHDPMWLATLRAMEGELVTDSLVYRYDPAASPDGLRGSEGTFSLCTFAYVDALARCGRLDEARLVFDKMLTYSNHLGLYSEEIALDGEQIGNFPQAFTHLSLIDAALTLDAAMKVRSQGSGDHALAPLTSVASVGA
ncbi:MAG TPA: glycoside hydrolase family 15 protein [Marmoricola sp.]|nr:glycoside hydrolase family 15 protein [Marmoricola sp.]